MTARYKITWQVVEGHEAEVTADELAALLGVEVEDIDSDDPLANAAFHLEDTLAELDYPDTYDGNFTRRAVEISMEDPS